MREGRRFYIRNQTQKGGGGGGIDFLIYLHKNLNTRSFPTEGSQNISKTSALIRDNF